jgi:hypothetical protein
MHSRCDSFVSLLAQFLAKYDPEETERHHIGLYAKLVNKDFKALCGRISVALPTVEDPWPWSRRHTADEWIRFYRDNASVVDAKSRMYRKRWAEEREAGPSQRKTPAPASTPKKAYGSTPRSHSKVPFDEQDKFGLMQWLAVECPTKKGRQSLNTYQRLVDKVRR